MRIVLLALDREPARAETRLQARFPDAEILILPVNKLESAHARQRLSMLRSLRPNIFAVATETLCWQQGQNALLAFGALGGAGRVLIFDAHGESREEAAPAALARAPSRLAREAWLSRLATKQAERALTRLERAIQSNLGSVSAVIARNRNPLSMAYLRTTPAAGTQSGGATTHTTGFINAAAELGLDVSVLSNDKITGLDQAKLSIKIFLPEPWGLTRPAFDLRNGLIFTERASQDVLANPPDFIYQRYSRFNWSGVELGLESRRSLFLEYNGSEVWMAKHWGRLRLAELLERSERLNLAAATRIFVVAEVERNNLLKSGVPDEKIVVNPNGVDVGKFQPGIGGGEVRRELGIDESEVLCGFVGTFGPWHGVLTLAEAINVLPENSRMRFLLIGGGALQTEVERIIQQAGRLERVIFTGQVGHERVPRLLDACDILLSPHVPLSDGSEFFGSPTKLFEYMAMGKGIIASRLGQIGEVLAHEKTALLVQPGNAQELAAAILKLSSSTELRERLGAAARLEAIQRHTWKRNAQRVIDSYHQLLE